MLNGYGGQVLRVNLTRGTVDKSELDPNLARDYLGGRGFAAKILYSELQKGIDPLGEANKVIAAAGPLSGLLIPGAGKTTFAAKSPATGGYGDSNLGGLFSAEMKYAGYDLIIVEGVSPKPVYLFIEDDIVELRDAGEYWGQGAITAETALKRDLGDDFQIAVIGPGGENLVKFACICHDFGRQAGRTGVGAVMGSKRLKAIAIRGTHSIPVADVGEFRRVGREMLEYCKNSDAWDVWVRLGTAGVNVPSNEWGSFPTHNFQTGHFENMEKMTGEYMREKIVVTDKACFGCPCACGKYSYTKKWDVRVEGPEYETAAFLGADVGLSDIEDVAYANYLCDELGIDTISAGNVIAFATECFERGIIGPKDTGGLELGFGDPEAVFELIQKIARREGIGDTLAEGARHAAEVFGGDSQHYAMQIKGLEISGYESRDAPAMMLAYMTADVGAHHNRAWAITYDIEVGRDAVTEDKAARVIELQHIRPLMDALGTCRLQWVELGLPLDYYVSAMKSITGLDRSWEDLTHIAERVWNLTRAFWVREIDGFGREWDYPPPRWYSDPVPSGPSKGKVVSKENVEKLLDMYYKQRGWDQNGIPTREKLDELGLGFVKI
ncbi:MAG TPA: aldehyde ferredoxin oxidoreductase family protein [Anaerolineae bacterium]|nr:aldehyde ferredoxin oxidoreductase family protein [Anaerolineae bacterium]